MNTVRGARLEDRKIQSGRQLKHIVLGVYDNFAPSYLAPVLHQLRHRFPEVEITSQVGEFEALATGILAGMIHLAITYDLGLEQALKSACSPMPPPYAFAAPDNPLTRAPQTSLAKLASNSLISFNQGLSIRHMIGLFRAQGLLPRITHRASSLEVRRSLAANGEGIGISYPKPPNTNSYNGKPRCAIPITDKAARKPVVLAYIGENQTMPPLNDVIHAMVEMNAPNGGAAPEIRAARTPILPE